MTKSESDSISDTTNVVNTDSVTYQKVQESEKEIVVNVDSVLRLNINKDKEITSDSIYNAIGDFGENQLFDGITLGLTRLEKDGNVFAIFTNFGKERDVIKFYVLENKEWNLVDSFETDELSYYLNVDLNNDGVKEIHTIGYPNMNGNHWNNFYSFSKEENKFMYGGGFFSSMYEFKPQLNRIEVEYGGSWYMPNTKTIYYWKNQKLIPFKEVEVGLKIADMKHDAQYIKYSENLTLEKDSVQLVYKKSFRGKKLNQFYDNFFENN